MPRHAALAILLVLLTATTQAQRLKHAFGEKDVPAAPDYSKERYWAAMPHFSDPADLTPVPWIVEGQDSAVVDVFYIHPTTINHKYRNWNHDLTDQRINRRVDKWPIRHQASIFNGVARVFAPRYRQANYEAFMALDDSSSIRALALALGDVITAFEYYMAHHNNGRPFIIAAHSQGTFHAMRLVASRIDGSDRAKRMVAAYLVGMPVSDTLFTGIPPCTTATQTRCFLSWNTMKRNNYPDFYDDFYEDAVCINPINWTTDTTYAPRSEHLGVVAHKFNKVVEQRFGARVRDHVLWVDPVNLPGIPFTRFKKNWHVADYNLFWVNVRRNLEERVSAFLGGGVSSTEPND